MRKSKEIFEIPVKKWGNSYDKRGKKTAIVCWMQCILENIVGQNFDLSKPLYNYDYYVLFSKKLTHWNWRLSIIVSKNLNFSQP